jgi:hypothetical protein
MYQEELGGGSSPAEATERWVAIDANKRYLDLFCRLTEEYAGGGLTVMLKWGSAATSGNGRWAAAIRRIADDAEDLDTSHTYDFNTIDAATPNVVAEVAYDNITFTDGADMDSLAAGEFFILRIMREGDHANDTLTATAHLYQVAVKET